MPLGKPLLEALERMRCGGVLLDVKGDALQINSTAERLLRNGVAPQASGDGDWARNAIKTLLRHGTARFTLSKEAWFVVPRGDRRPLAMHAVPIGDGARNGVHTAIILIDLEEAPEPNPTVLQKMFGLTAAEADLAIRLARGETPADIAQEKKITIATVRSQLASVLAKTRTKRQAELVSLLARVSLLP
jgi:DNA-binding CsgD family transcriptional regulator